MLNQEGEVEQDLETMMLSLDNLEMEKNDQKSFQRVFFWLISTRILRVQGYLESMNWWILFKTLMWKRKRAWKDKMKEKIVGHIPLYLPKAIFSFLQRSQSKLPCVVMEKWVKKELGFGIEIPIKSTFHGLKKALPRIQEKQKKKQTMRIL